MGRGGADAGAADAGTVAQGVFLFNVIVGTGLFGLPRLFALAGGGLATGFLALVGALSYVCATWLVESLSITSVVMGRGRGGRDGGEAAGLPQLKDWSLRPATPWVTQNGHMAMVLFGRVGQVAWFVTLIVYLYGDLAVYAVFVPDTLMRVFPQVWLGNTLLFQCNGVYYFGLVLFLCAMVPFVFFPFRKTFTLQVITGLQRHIVFWTIIIWSVALYTSGSSPDNDVPGGEMPKPTAAEKGADWKKGPALLFGNAVYAFICQQYIASIVAPMKNKVQAGRLVACVITGVLIYYMLLCWTTLHAFPTSLLDNSNDIVTFAFKNVRPLWLAKLVLAVPLLGVSTNYPLIAVVLRDHLIILWNMVRKKSDVAPRNSRHLQNSVDDAVAPLLEQEQSSNLLKSADETPFATRVVVGLVAALPSFLLAATRANVGTIIALSGSYGGCMIMFVFPALFVYAGRQLLEKNRDLPAREANPFRSPFQSVVWQVLVLVWAASALVIVTHHFATDGFGGSDTPPCTPLPKS